MSDLKYPVYAGEDGSIVIFNTDQGRWEQQNQTHDKSNSYWVVSIKKKCSDDKKPRLERDVHRLICESWKGGERTSDKSRVDHINGNRDDNRVANLCWTNALGNATKAQKAGNAFDPTFSEIVIDCQKLNRGDSIVSAVSIRKTSGACVPASEMFSYVTGRPLTRLSSLFDALYRMDAGKSNEKVRCMIDVARVVVLDDATPFPERILVSREPDWERASETNGAARDVISPRPR